MATKLDARISGIDGVSFFHARSSKSTGAKSFKLNKREMVITLTPYRLDVEKEPASISKSHKQVTF